MALRDEVNAAKSEKLMGMSTEQAAAQSWIENVRRECALFSVIRIKKLDILTCISVVV